MATMMVVMVGGDGDDDDDDDQERRRTQGLKNERARAAAFRDGRPGLPAAEEREPHERDAVGRARPAQRRRPALVREHLPVAGLLQGRTGDRDLREVGLSDVHDRPARRDGEPEHPHLPDVRGRLHGRRRRIEFPNGTDDGREGNPPRRGAVNPRI